MGSDQSFQHLAEAEAWIAHGDFLGEAPVSALYVSSGRDPKPLSLLHPEFLSNQADEVVPAPNFFVYVDLNEIEENLVTSFNLDDNDWQAQIQSRDLGYASLKGSPGRLLLVRWRSERFAERTCVVWFLSVKNDWFARAALADGWSPTWFIGVCDGCPWSHSEPGELGHPCVNHLGDLESSIPIRLNARYWVTDHLDGAVYGVGPPSQGENPMNGDVIVPQSPEAHCVLRQVCFLSSEFCGPSAVTGLHGGARVFAVEPRRKRRSSTSSRL